MDDKLTEFRVKLGLRIKQLRENRKLTQSFLASKVGEGKDKQVINRYENQGANPSAYQLKQLSDALQFSTDDFYDFSEIDPNEVMEIIEKLKRMEKKQEFKSQQAT